ncbi:hypothetical protein PRZ48_008195 [Zasmidium cellare]|uniref:Heterokaryon incompatibility domain-containing protein n=1 Tax=Zasmidium cellare TaxID=395010 RepID=A0ABR0EF55_ZASCE|nr:hypothetical protein PRZ48_008195 [Zasmidium cellare]
MFKAEYKDDESDEHRYEPLADNGQSSQGDTFPSKAAATDPTYVHQPLENAEKQIRLLQIKPCISDDEDIELRSSVWSLDAVRPFFAISYTWGEPRTRILWIDGKPYNVRLNCHYVLWQARRHHPGSFVWVDSICIDQENLEEKGCQVRIMAEIYAAAKCVLVGVGQEEDGSELIAKFTAEVSRMGDRAPQMKRIRKWKLPTSQGDWPAWEASVDSIDRELMFRAYPQFAQRPYWNRLWIVQEIAAARSIEILCGEVVISWNALIKLTVMLATVLGQLDDESTILAAFGHEMIRVISFAHLNRYSLDRALGTYNSFQCSDPRDHIFGILSLLDSDKQHLSTYPDYTLTTFDIALHCVAHMKSLERVASLLSSLRLGTVTPEIERLCAQKGLHSAPGSSGGSQFPLLPSVYLAGSGKVETFCVCLYPSEGWELVDFLPEEEDRNQSASLERIRRVVQESASLSSAFKQFRPKCVHIKGSNTVALACHDVRMGDVLALVGDWRCKLLLILRHVVGARHEIVGQAFVMDDICMPAVWSDKLGEDQHNQGKDEGSDIPLFTASVELTMTPEDALSFVGQDLVKLGHFDLAARLQRLVTAPVQKSSTAAATVDNIETSSRTMHRCAESKKPEGWWTR